MLQQALFDVWAPPDSVWSPWVKPVLFAHLDQHSDLRDEAQWDRLDTAWAPSTSVGTALVIDLPGASSVHFGVALALKGYRPVPLFNGAPGPARAQALVDVSRTMGALRAGGERLERIELPGTAPPAFLLESERLSGTGQAAPRRFDNRWKVFPQDMPSAAFLKGEGIHDVLLVQERPGQPQEDLCHVLRRWQDASLPLHCCVPASSQVEMIMVRRPPRYRAMWYRTLAMMGLRRNSTGGFGSIVPAPSSGGGGFA